MILTVMNNDWLQLNEMLPAAKEVLEALQKMDESAQDNQEKLRKRRYQCNGQVAIENDSRIQDTAGAARL